MIDIKFKKLSDNAILPVNANPYDAGIDFYSSEYVVIHHHDRRIVPTGLIWEPSWLKGNWYLKHHFKIYMKIYSRSGLSLNKGIEVGAGVIDQEYRGEIKILLYNHSNEKLYIKTGDKIAQGIVYVIPNISISLTDTVTKTVRGEGGFGSTDA